MPRYRYQGRDTKGKKSGTIHATSRREAVIKLRDSGIRVIQIDEVPETLLTKDLSISNPVKLQDFTIFLRQFSTLIKAGISVVDSMDILANQTSSKALRRTLVEVEADLREGISLSTATAKHKKIFSTLFTNMVRVGEVGGTLDETLERLATHFEKQHKTKQKIKSAMAYPAVIGVVAIGVVIFLLTSVVPTFVGMFSDFGAELPAITKFVLHASEFTQSKWWLLILIAFLFYLSIVIIKQNKKTKFYYDYFILKMPIFGKMLQKSVLARMTRTLSSLISSSVPILQALAVVESIVENEVIAEVIKESRASLEKGRSMTVPMKKHWAFPPLITQMIIVGESTGSLDEMLGKVANFYEDEVEIATDKLKSLIEPLMIVVLSGIVGTIVTSIMVPMFDIFNKIQ
ncbi:type II secretion system F family protein [Ferdinandcohnia quinoae]|uniref:Type II secretion system F family protein n=1 Tax=Fredinandcohnia quinoae TaxID=2918902 RepID=A0AAW5E9L5_9BACI|nr:type II secretion system F family protein [Fredinandcohnia sp. SECRCQ15]MCH1626572.1 type II secretion system F family protein [Fredinandcohnia sp. SECRCQ15]